MIYILELLLQKERDYIELQMDLKTPVGQKHILSLKVVQLLCQFG
jgi:hypothetical protein